MNRILEIGPDHVRGEAGATLYDVAHELERQDRHPPQRLPADGSVNPAVRADTVYLEQANGGAVLATGSCAWTAPSPTTTATTTSPGSTRNFLDRFLAD